jgi:D-tyrosyl-tRNA(Tyr) deacylase
MRAVVQRVSSASVTVGGDTVGRIGPGLCVLVGVTHDDDLDAAHRLAARLAHLRIFPDEAGRMNRSTIELGRPVLLISQFTLYADTARGRRPSFGAAAPGAVAQPVIDEVGRAMVGLGVRVETGRFGADMEVALVNDGPVTLLVEI